MCYPPSFGAAQVGNVSVFVSPSIGELPRLVGTSTPLSYVNNVICAAKSVISGSGLCFGEFFEQCVNFASLTFSPATVGEVARFSIQSYDEIGRRVDISPELLFLLVKSNEIVGMGSSLCQIIPEKSIFASLQLISNASAVVSYKYNLSGPTVLQGALLQPGGLSLQIFDGPFFDEPQIIAGVVPSVYSAVDMHFGGGLINIGFSRFYSTITTLLVWKGFIVPRFTESYTFQLSSNGCTNVNISGRMLFTCSNKITDSLKLRENELHAVEVSYRHLNGEPSLVLLWESLSQQREIIPFGRWQVPFNMHLFVLFCNSPESGFSPLALHLCRSTLQ